MSLAPPAKSEIRSGRYAPAAAAMICDDDARQGEPAKSQVTDFVIAGGGLTGVAAALALARNGIAATVVEALPEAPADKWGLLLWPTGTAVLRSLGLASVDDLGCRLDAFRWYVQRYRSWTGADLRQFSSDATFIGISPSQLQKTATVEAKRLGVSFSCPGEVVAVEHDAARQMRVIVRSPVGEMEEIRCRALIVANGINSRLRAQVGIKARIRHARGQSILTGIGGGVPFAESRQAFGNRWSGGCVPLEKHRTWFYAVIPSNSRADVRSALEQYADVDPEAASGLSELGLVHTIEPTRLRVAQWANGSCIALGDSAHGMFPYLGLGGNANLEEIPILTEIIKNALLNHDNQPLRLEQLQRRRQARVRYLQRLSTLFSLFLAPRLLGVTLVRDWNFRRLARKPHLTQNFFREVASGGVPSIRARAGVLLP